MFDVLHRHVNQKIIPTGQHKDREHLGQRHERVVDGVDDVPGERPHLHGDERLDPAVQRGQVDARRVAGDDPVLAQQTNPFQAGRWRNTDSAGQIPVGLPSVSLEFRHDCRINFIHALQLAARTEFCSALEPHII